MADTAHLLLIILLSSIPPDLFCFIRFQFAHATFSAPPLVSSPRCVCSAERPSWRTPNRWVRTRPVIHLFFYWECAV